MNRVDERRTSLELVELLLTLDRAKSCPTSSQRDLARAVSRAHRLVTNVLPTLIRSGVFPTLTKHDTYLAWEVKYMLTTPHEAQEGHEGHEVRDGLTQGASEGCGSTTGPAGCCGDGGRRDDRRGDAAEPTR